MCDVALAPCGLCTSSCCSMGALPSAAGKATHKISPCQYAVCATANAAPPTSKYSASCRSKCKVANVKRLESLKLGRPFVRDSWESCAHHLGSREIHFSSFGGSLPIAASSQMGDRFFPIIPCSQAGFSSPISAPCLPAKSFLQTLTPTPHRALSLPLP